MLLAPLASAQLPATRLYAVAPPGGQLGTSFELQVSSGDDLEGVDRLLFSHPGITAEQRYEPVAPFRRTADPAKGRFDVTIAADVPPGIYEVRALGKYGVSNPRAFVVSDRPELIESGRHDTFASAMEVPLGTITNGTTETAATDYYRFEARRGDRVLIDAWAERIDSRADATLVLYDSRGRELARDRDTNGRDALIDFSVPADGTYVVEIFDFVYGGGNEHFYRLSIGTGPYLDFVFPPAGPAGSSLEYTLFGRNLPGGKPVEGLFVDGRPLEAQPVTIELPSEPATRPPGLDPRLPPSSAALDGVAFRLDEPEASAAAVFVGAATASPVTEREPNDDPTAAQAIELPCEIAGQFAPEGDNDWFTFEAKKGDVYEIEVISARLAAASDPYLLIQRVTGDGPDAPQAADVRDMDDDREDVGGIHFSTRSDDPKSDWTVPADGRYRVLIRDLYYHGDPRFVYRLAIRRARPDFRMVAVAPYPAKGFDEARPWSPLVRRGGTEQIDVLLLRGGGFKGAVEISVDGLPDGVACPPVTIASGSDRSALVLSAGESVATWEGPLRIVARATVDGQTIEREARYGTVVWPAGKNVPAPARLTDSLPLATSASESVPFTVTVGAPEGNSATPGAKLELPVNVARRDGFDETITLSPISLPRGVKMTAKTVALKGNVTEGKLTLDVDDKAAAGEYTVMFQAETKLDYAHYPEGVDRADAAKREIDEAVAALAKAIESAESAGEPAAKLAELKSQHAAAVEAQKAAQKRVDDATAAAKPKSMNVDLPVPSVRLTIAPAS